MLDNGKPHHALIENGLYRSTGLDALPAAMAGLAAALMAAFQHL